MSNHPLHSTTQIHLAAAFHAPRFSEYVKSKLATEAETIVAVDGGVKKSLSQLFTEAGLDESCLGLDAFHILGKMRWERCAGRCRGMGALPTRLKP